MTDEHEIWNQLLYGDGQSGWKIPALSDRPPTSRELTNIKRARVARRIIADMPILDRAMGIDRGHRMEVESE